MKKTTILLAIMLMLVASIVSAGSIGDLNNDDCTKMETDCVNWECTHWHKNHCQHWGCTDYEDYCAESIDTTIDDNDVYVDADVVQGVDVVNYIETHESSWNKDNVGSSGLSDYDVGEMLNGNKYFFNVWNTASEWLHSIFATKIEIEGAHMRMDLIEARLDNPNGSDLVIGLAASNKKAARTGVSVMFEDYLCSGMMCIKVVAK